MLMSFNGLYCFFIGAIYWEMVSGYIDPSGIFGTGKVIRVWKKVKSHSDPVKGGKKFGGKYACVKRFVTAYHQFLDH